ncbi:MAG: rhomboid family intramembrane serine protease [Calditrichaeota bacterium]|nr:MAG: rhomboid family intramembrane serine protease [Calditrichota bacterium]
MYMRPSFGMITPGIKNLILANVTVFLLQIFFGWLINPWVFGIVPSRMLGEFFIWQPVTYMFLHSPTGFGHIFFNMFALWMFGTELERTMGTKEFLRYYFLTGILAGVSIFVWNLFMGIDVPTIGASGAVFGILMAYAMFFPDRYIYLWFLFPIKAKYFALLFGVLEFLMLPSGDGISHIGHLGGMIAGFFYLRHNYRHWGIGQDFFRNFFKKKDLF